MKRRKLPHPSQLMLPGFVEPILAEIDAQGLPIIAEHTSAHYRALSWSAYGRCKALGVRCEYINLYRIRERDMGICYLCKLVVAPTDENFDHVYPVSRGGPHVRSNVALTHRDCNFRKGDRTLEEIVRENRLIVSQHWRDDKDGLAAQQRIFRNGWFDSDEDAKNVAIWKRSCARLEDKLGPLKNVQAPHAIR
jgi:hypothetical protein